MTVKRALDSQGSLGYDVFESQMLVLLLDFPWMPVTEVAQRVGWPG